MSEPFFSLIIPVYNRANRISKAVESIFEQSFTDWELIIVNDASTDNTAQIINSIVNSKVKVIHNATNLERCISRNLGIAAARGNYICFLDSDDYHLTNHLSELYKSICEKKMPEALFFTNAYDESEDGIRSERLCPDFIGINPYEYFLRFTVNPQRWAVHKNVFKKVRFDPQVTICEDMDTSMRILAAGFDVFQVKMRTTVYVAAADSFTHGDSNKAAKELFYLKRIFTRRELHGKLPLIPRLRLKSMCHYHIAIKMQKDRKILQMYWHILISFFQYPKGYNGKTLLPMAVMLVYELPLVGKFIKLLIRLTKK